MRATDTQKARPRASNARVCARARARVHFLLAVSVTNVYIAVGTAVTEDTSVTSVTRGRPLLALKLVKTSQC